MLHILTVQLIKQNKIIGIFLAVIAVFERVFDVLWGKLQLPLIVFAWPDDIFKYQPNGNP